MSIEPSPNVLTSGIRGRRRGPWRSVLILFGIIGATMGWYVVTVDAIRDEVDRIPPAPGHPLKLWALDDREGVSYGGYFLKNVSRLPITVLGIQPIQVPSDWRLREMRLGSLSGGADPAERTRPFTSQHLAPGETLRVVIVWDALPCDSPRLADGAVSGPVQFGVLYSILGIHRTATFRQGGGGFSPTSVTGGYCPTPAG